MRARPGALVLLLAAGCSAFEIRSNEPLVDIRDLDQSIVLDVRYATPNNFTRRTLYPVGRCLLRQSVAKRLALVQADLAESGFGLKIWDCYRPLSIQRELWRLVHDPRYVADPRKGSRHNRGAAVDATLVDRVRSSELEMPTGYDDFSERAHRSSLQASPGAQHNRALLEEAMARRGFVGLPTEWWHFDAQGWEAYPLLDAPLDSRPSRP